MLHTHEATGSSPVVSTIGPPKLHSFGGFSLFFATFSQTLFLVFWSDPQVDPHEETTRKDERVPGRNFCPVLLFGTLPFSHLTADHRSDGVCRILLHLCCGVGIRVQRKPCRVVPQGTGEGFHVHTILQGQSCKKVPHIVEPNVFRAYCFQDFIMSPPERIRIIHRSGFWRWEHICITWVLFVFLNQEVNCLLRNCQRPYRVLRLRRTDHQFPFNTVDLFCNGDRSGLGIQVRPKEGKQFSPSQARRQF